MGVRQNLGRHAVNLSTQTDELFNIGSFDLYFDGSALADIAGKKTGLLNNGDHTGNFSQNTVDIRKQFSGSLLYLGDNTHKNGLSPGHIEEVGCRREIKLLGQFAFLIIFNEW